MKQYLIVPSSNVPQIILDYWGDSQPADFDATYLIYSYTPELAALIPDIDWEPDQTVDTQGNRLQAPGQMVKEYFRKLYNPTNMLRVPQADMHTMQRDPRTPLHVGRFSDESELMSACAKVDITPTGSTLAAKIASAKSKIKNQLIAT